MDGLLSQTSFSKRSWSAIGLLVFQTSGDCYLPPDFLGVSVKAPPFDSDHAECPFAAFIERIFDEITVMDQDDNRIKLNWCCGTSNEH